MRSNKVIKYCIITCDVCGHDVAADGYELQRAFNTKDEVPVECAFCGHFIPVTRDALEGKVVTEVK